jgi:hypothetical protein
VARVHGGGLHLRLAQQRQAAQHGAFGVVLVHLLRAEGGQHAVAGVLHHAAAVAVDQAREGGQRRVHHALDVLRLEVLAQRGGAHHIEEQHRHLAQRLRGLGFGQARAPRTECGQRHLDRLVAQQRALHLQLGDGGVDLVAAVGHGGADCGGAARGGCP